MAGVVNKFVEKQFDEESTDLERLPALANSGKSFYERVWPVIAWRRPLLRWLLERCDRLSVYMLESYLPR
ncbi:hypothetical protein H072_8398 [Dactylellina haptotyla CBS 200.50]|uniref:Uncharacterized protein n=1 Tax=Dactylellina haptotyla (strain CBS 200.50) TaxID=1284197 RepID=S8A9L6_DACHA|nr:hypothetical protein H072_8398 [Dactylellina haptotyla CBS 200.50]